MPNPNPVQGQVAAKKAADARSRDLLKRVASFLKENPGSTFEEIREHLSDNGGYPKTDHALTKLVGKGYFATSTRKSGTVGRPRIVLKNTKKANDAIRVRKAKASQVQEPVAV